MRPPPAEPARHFAPPGARSRLVPVDAGLDPEVLRRRHADAPVVVLPAVIGMRYRRTANEGPSVWAEVQSLVTADVSIPSRLRYRLPAARLDATTPARYEVEFRVGQLGAPWIEDIRPLPASPAAPSR